MKVLTALVAGAMCVSATPAVEGRFSSSIPPERYQGLGAVVTVFVPFDNLNGACGTPRIKGKTLLGCTRLTAEGVPVVILPDACPAAINGERYALIVCHEVAHARGGWGANHEM